MASTDTVDWILKQSHRYPLLTPEQEIVYGRQVKTWLELRDLPNPTRQQQALIRRGLHAYHAFFNANIRLSVMAARKFHGAQSTLEREDLIQEGLIGLQQAIVRFDPARGYKFSTFAFRFIVGTMSRGIDNYGRTIRIPVHASERVRKVLRYMDEQSAHGPRPTLADAAAHFNYSLTSLRQYCNHFNRQVSLDAPFPGRSENSLLTYIDAIAEQAPEGNWASEQLHDLQDLQDALEQLTPKQRTVVQMLYGADSEEKTSIAAIARTVGGSREGVRQQHLRAINRLRKCLNVSFPADLDSAIQPAA